MARVKLPARSGGSRGPACCAGRRIAGPARDLRCRTSFQLVRSSADAAALNSKGRTSAAFRVLPRIIMPKERLDKLLVDKGLAETRTKAQAMIMAGQVLVEEQRVDKPGHAINPDASIRIKGEPPRYVSRGGLKLEAALSEFAIDPTGKTCIDIGASTGGFTDCLLQNGASQVWALDVGHNQLAWRIRQDPRVTIIERRNARELGEYTFLVRFDLATIDVSFISLTMVL